MAERSPIMPAQNQRSEVIPWPSEPGPEAETHSMGQVHMEQVQEMSRSGVSVVTDSVRNAQRNLRDLTESMMRRLRRFADERPLYVVGMFAGAAFAAGVALRIWRSRYVWRSRYE